VAVDSAFPLLALVVAGGFACAGVDDATDGGGRQDAVALVPDGGPTNSLGCSFKATVPLVPQPADLLVLLDRSGSMDTAFGSGTRLQAVASELTDVVTAFAEHVRFGYQELPGRQGCSGQAGAGCCASAPTVGVAADNVAAVVAAIAAASPVDGNTPTAAALRAADGYYDALADGIDNRYVLLATDGAPNCTLAGDLSAGNPSNVGACADALAEVAALVSAGVRVIVLGVGPDLAADTTGEATCLDALAHAGGAAASPGSPGYYSASDPVELQLAIEQIFGGITRPSCVLPFRSGVVDTTAVALYLDGQQIPRTSQNGWRLDTSVTPPVARVTGVYCDEIQAFQVKTIEARFGCPPCIDILECQ
jgi:hypothetical protein